MARKHAAFAALLLLSSFCSALASRSHLLLPEDAPMDHSISKTHKEEHAVKQTVLRAKTAGNDKPLIGILTQPCSECPGKSYVAAGYVKWIEMAGGRAVPIRFYDSDDELKRLFNAVNGLVFPGGLTWLWLDAPYVITARKLFNWAVEANNKGDMFPIHGTCLGFQLLHILVSNVSRNYLLVDTDSVAHRSTLEFTPAAAKSRFMGALPEDLVTKFADRKEPIALQNHMYGIPPDHYQRWPILQQWYNILTTSVDRNGTRYVSTMEAKKYPFTGTQWHPEKYGAEFGMEEIPHTLDTIRMAQHLSNQFIETARHSSHAPVSHEEELAMVIYSYNPVFSARFEIPEDDNYDGPDITYYFDKHEDPPSGGGGGGEDGPDAPEPSPAPSQAQAAKHAGMHPKHSPMVMA